MLQEVNFSLGGPFAFRIKMKYCAPTITRDMQKNPSKGLPFKISFFKFLWFCRFYKFTS